MERICDEIVQLIFYELTDPGPLTLVSKRFHRFSQDPYVRAHYFLTHYGPTEAMFYALGRGKILSEHMLDILLTSGAHLSRYLIQISIHHYFYTQSHFIKTSWIRSVPLGVFTYFLKLAEQMYGDIPRGKGEDDGSIFNTFLTESRLPSTLKTVSWETIQKLLEKYNFIPFSNKDPLMAQFPLVLAIEPRLLPNAVKNGFHMDTKYRDFVFRKMFERPAASSDTLPDEITQNVRELCKLDSNMFVSRTVAAEVCMEAKSNVGGYSALKILDKSGHLRFELARLVEDLIKSFYKTRSISYPTTIETLRFLYADFPSSDPTVRLVILIAFFNATEHLHSHPSAIHTKLDTLNLTPLTRNDVLSILVNPFVDRYQLLLDYAKWSLGEKEDGTKGMGTKEFRGLVGEIVSRCLEAACKGKLLKKLLDGYPFVLDLVSQAILETQHITIEDLPTWDDFQACYKYEAKFCRDYTREAYGLGGDLVVNHTCSNCGGKSHTQADEFTEAEGEGSNMDEVNISKNLGYISQESLTTMIRRDEVLPVRSRRRVHYPPGFWIDSSGKLPYPHEPLQVGRWIKNVFGPRSRITAMFMIHAVINDNSSVLQYYLGRTTADTFHMGTPTHVPITLKHFRLLAHLGKTPNYQLWAEIEDGVEFFLDEDEYLKLEEKVTYAREPVKAETSSGRTMIEPYSSSSGVRRCKRPRRTAAEVGSYAVPDSDDETIAGDDFILKKTKVVDTPLQKWIIHLSVLLKEEQRKLKQKKKPTDVLEGSGSKTRTFKSEFFKSLSSNLKNFRRIETEHRLLCYGHETLDNTSSDDGDKEYRQRPKIKRRKIERVS